eukprot:Hpha_TRINITY_DN30247_c0_g1::TRINITY_DN30247_c0_g1_i1::g.27009::m.27009/K17608/STRN1_3_4; striatin 1/3/4
MDISGYTYVGVLAWLEQEWRRFHREREEWASERAVLSGMVSALQGKVGTLQEKLQAADTDARRWRRKAAGSLVSEQSEDELPPTETVETLRLLARQPRRGSAPEAEPLQSQGALPLASVQPHPVPPVAPAAPASEAPVPQPPAQPPVQQPTPQQAEHAQQQRHIVSPRPKPLPAPPGSNLSSSVNSMSEARSSTGGEDSDADTVLQAFSADPSASQSGLATVKQRVGESKSQRRDIYRAQEAAVKQQASEMRRMGSEAPGSPTPEETGSTAPAAGSESAKGERRHWELRSTVRGHFGPVRCACWSGDGAVAVTGGDDGAVRMWDTRRMLRGRDHRDDPIRTLRGPVSAVLSVDSTRDEVLAGCADGQVRLWQLPQQGEEGEGGQGKGPGLGTVLHGHSDAVWGLSILRGQGADATLSFCSCSADGALLLWRRGSAGAPPAVERRIRPATELRVPGVGSGVAVNYSRAPDGTRRVLLAYAAESWGGGIALFSVQAADATVVWHRALSARPTCLSAPPGLSQWARRRGGHIDVSVQCAAVGDSGGGVDVFDASDGRSVVALGPHTDAVTSVEYCAECMLTSSHDGTVRRHEAEGVCTELAVPHERRLGEVITGLVCHAAKGVTVTIGADSSIAVHTAPKT